MIPDTVAADADVTVTITGPLIHLCPFRDEEDLGTITLTWACHGQTFELHSLAEYLGCREQTQLSHEEITDRIAFDLGSVDGLDLLSIETTWTTAGMGVTCSTSPTPAAASQSPRCAPDTSA